MDEGEVVYTKSTRMLMSQVCCILPTPAMLWKLGWAHQLKVSNLTPRYSYWISIHSAWNRYEKRNGSVPQMEAERKLNEVSEAAMHMSSKAVTSYFPMYVCRD